MLSRGTCSGLSSCQIEITSSIKFAGGRGRVSQQSSVILFHSLPKKHSSTERVGGWGITWFAVVGFQAWEFAFGQKGFFVRGCGVEA